MPAVSAAPVVLPSGGWPASSSSRATAPTTASVNAEDLSDLIEQGAELGALLARRCLDALAIPGHEAESFGKAAIVGEAGELEHAAAPLHPKMGAPVRAARGRG